MLTLKVGLIRLKKIFERINHIKNRHRIWRRHALVSAATVLMSLATVMLMTGVLYFANDVLITDEGVTRKFFTMKDEPEEILAEFGYVLGEFDRLIHFNNEDGSNSIDIIRGFPVEVDVDGGTFTAGAVAGETADMILAANSVQVGRYDMVTFNENKISLLRGFGVRVTADGDTVIIGTIGATVGEILAQAAIVLGEDDAVNIAVEAAVAPGDEIIVSRVTFRERTDIEKTPYETLRQYSNLMAIGDREVVEGVYGELTTVYFEKLVDGAVVSSQVLSRELTREPQTRVVTYGRALRTPYSQRDFPEIRLENGIPVDYIAKHTGKSTAYTAPPTSGTASGRPLVVGSVAVDPRVIPYGSLVYVKTTCGTRVYGAAIASDTGDFPHNGSNVLIDVFMGLTSESYHEALRWGVWNVDVYVINTGIY
jgi:uncharacterized protein YabE (DUF348 family)/3D (Asp-Asp-Asp) domain-containing protein